MKEKLIGIIIVLLMSLCGGIVGFINTYINITKILAFIIAILIIVGLYFLIKQVTSSHGFSNRL